MIIQFFILRDIVTHFIEQNQIQKSVRSDKSYQRYTAELDWNQDLTQTGEWLRTLHVESNFVGL